MPAAKQRTVNIGGVAVQVFSVGFLAAALNRKRESLRRWERDGWTPPPVLTFGKRTGRIYTPEEVEAYRRVFQIENARNGVAFPASLRTALFAEVAAIKKRYASLFGGV